MKYIKKYESFKSERSEEVNEGLMDILRAAGGALKNFLTGIMAPFKTIKDDFKKGLKFEEVKTKFITAMDQLLKTASDNINKAKDENEINQMNDAFTKELEEKMAEFDKEIKTVKESKLYEGKVQNALIGGRVLFGMVKAEYDRLKKDFDTKFAQAKDLAAKKTVAIQRIKEVIESSKKKIGDEKLVSAATQKYKQDNKIVTTDNPEILKSYGVTKKEELVGKEVRYKTKKFDANKKPEEQPDNVGKLKVLKVTADGLIFDGEKEDFEKKMDDVLPAEGAGKNPEDELKTNLGDVKQKNAEGLDDINKFTQLMEDPTKNADKIKRIKDILGEGEKETVEQ
jgi:hypothetical protein